MRTVTNSMGSVVKGMDKAMESMNLERVSMPRASETNARPVRTAADLTSLFRSAPCDSPRHQSNR